MHATVQMADHIADRITDRTAFVVAVRTTITPTVHATIHTTDNNTDPIAPTGVQARATVRTIYTKKFRIGNLRRFKYCWHMDYDLLCLAISTTNKKKVSMHSLGRIVDLKSCTLFVR